MSTRTWVDTSKLDTFVLKLDVTNFGAYREYEVARILRKIAERLETVDCTQSDARKDYRDEHGSTGWVGHYQTILDERDNDVGRYAFKNGRAL